MPTTLFSAGVNIYDETELDLIAIEDTMPAAETATDL